MSRYVRKKYNALDFKGSHRDRIKISAERRQTECERARVYELLFSVGLMFVCVHMCLYIFVCLSSTICTRSGARAFYLPFSSVNFYLITPETTEQVQSSK